MIVFENVSKFYGEVLGVNRVNLSIEPGISSLVGPNGAGKTTLMNLMTGLLRPTKGRIRVLGVQPSDAEKFHRNVGYCSQFDSFPRGVSGHQLISAMMRIQVRTLGRGFTAVIANLRDRTRFSPPGPSTRSLTFQEPIPDPR